MGYQVYWANGRWQGYGVPAYCDHKGCKEEIDRGMGFAQYKYDNQPPAFFCEKHMPDFEKFIDDYEIDLGKEHPEWLSHVLNDESWKQWREENPDIVKEYANIV